MSTGVRLLPLALLLAGGSWFATSYVTARTSVSVEQPTLNDAKLVVAPDDLDLGVVFAEKALSHVLVVTNRSSESVTVEKFRASCSCTSLTPESAVFLPGESKSFRLTINLTERPSWDRRETDRRFSSDISAKIAGSSTLLTWRLRAIVRDPIIVSDPVVDFAELNLNIREFPARSVTIECSEGIRDVEVDCDDQIAQLRLEPVPPMGDGSYLLSVSPPQKLPVGPFEICPTLWAFTMQGKVISCTPILIRGTFVDDYEFIPGTLHFGGIVVGTTSKQTAIVNHRRNIPFSIESMEIVGDGLTAKTSFKKELEAHAILISQKATAHGAQRDNLNIEVRDCDGLTKSLRLSLSYFGISDLQQPVVFDDDEGGHCEKP